MRIRRNVNNIEEIRRFTKRTPYDFVIFFLTVNLATSRMIFVKKCPHTKTRLSTHRHLIPEQENKIFSFFLDPDILHFTVLNSDPAAASAQVHYEKYWIRTPTRRQHNEHNSENLLFFASRCFKLWILCLFVFSFVCNVYISYVFNSLFRKKSKQIQVNEFLHT